MELQWPLIIFTTFVAWSAGLFAVQAVYALKGEAPRAQMPSLVTAFVIMVVGGIAVLFHLQHAERIFNGFGHITSGITQELIAIVVLALLMIVWFAFLRRENKVPGWLAWVAIVLSLVLIVVCGHSYMMPSRPAWDTFFQPLALVGAGAALGAGTFALIEALVGEQASGLTPKANVVTSWVCVATAVFYVAAIVATSGAFVDLGTTLDPTHPAESMVVAGDYSPFAGANVAATVVAVVAAALTVVCAYLGKRKGDWKVFGTAIVVFALVSAVALRIVFYETGGSLFMLY